MTVINWLFVVLSMVGYIGCLWYVCIRHTCGADWRRWERRREGIVKLEKPWYMPLSYWDFECPRCGLGKAPQAETWTEYVAQGRPVYGDPQ